MHIVYMLPVALVDQNVCVLDILWLIRKMYLPLFSKTVIFTKFSVLFVSRQKTQNRKVVVKNILFIYTLSKLSII